jgi:hypothetical protein
VWRDANDTLVGPSVILGDQVPYLDAQGFFWFINPMTAKIEAFTTDVVYDTANCGGTAYVRRLLRRMVFTIPGEPGTFRVYPDKPTLTKVQLQSVRSGGQCVNTMEETEVLPLAETLPATPLSLPATTFVGPLHLSVE